MVSKTTTMLFHRIAGANVTVHCYLSRHNPGMAELHFTSARDGLQVLDGEVEEFVQHLEELFCSYKRGGA